MPSFIMLTRLSEQATRQPGSLEELERTCMDRVRSECPDVEWKASYAVLGPCDYLDVFEAPDLPTAMKVTALIRTFGHATTEVWPATEWSDFKDTVRGLPGVGEGS